ncbi:helix-turn-helix transcriptional regulator [Streptomyces albipurpureus]|uniref:AAA family ATPase n=1 Tax=Streptomyces albipurpureus TaxID=2897419 RepID=A0ABT0UGM6_9ACTN|nr:LuxR family transcriptional regulator [Streptomyces sp. CWNU-1]MCM2387321.1 AAA family ATPase [Streptomyces sp. CWNU-1]
MAQGNNDTAKRDAAQEGATGSARSNGLRERTEHLARMESLARRTAAGTGGVAVIRGATGTGRTALLQALAAAPSVPGKTVLVSRCCAAESGAAFAAVLQLFEGPLHDRGERLPVVRGDSWDGSLHGDDLPSLLWRLLRSLALEHPVLLAVDDVHLADPASLRWLTQVARRLDRLPVLLAVTERWSHDLVPPPAPFAGATGQPSVELCTLKPLGAAAVAALVRDAFGAEAADSTVEECHRATAGNPLLLSALLADLRELGADGDRAARLPGKCEELHPGIFAGAVRRWLEACGPLTATAAQAVAELRGEDDVLALLPRMTGCDPARVAGWASGLRHTGLLSTAPATGAPVFAHPLLQNAVASAGPVHPRADLHRRAAEALHHRGDPEEAVARRLLEAPVVGAPWAADALIAVAARAVAGGRPADAVAGLRRALIEPLPPRRRAEVLTELGSLEVRANRTTGVRYLSEALGFGQCNTVRVRAATALGAALAADDAIHSALDVLGELSAAVSDTPDLAHAAQAAAALISSHDGESWLAAVARLKDTGERTGGGLALTAMALLTEHEATAGLISAREVMARISPLTSVRLDPLLAPYLLSSAATLAQWADELDEADALTARGLAAHRAPLLHPAQQSLLSVRAESTVMRGQYEALLRDQSLWRRLQPGELAVHPPGSVHLGSQAVIALTGMGRAAEAERLAAAIGADGPQGSWEWSELLYARGLLRRERGDLRGALADLLECGRRQSARETWSPVVTPWRSAAADCHVALGSAGSAVPLAEEELRFARIWGTPRAVGRALHALARSVGGRHGLELAEEAVDTLRGAAQPLPELIPALVDWGRALHSAGRGLRAREVLREAAEEAERLGAPSARHAAAEALRNCGARSARAPRTGTDALTSSERRIAQLAAAGYSNKETAELLHLAVRTVETHLTHCYRKLGVGGRSGLAAALGSDVPPASRPE